MSDVSGALRWKLYRIVEERPVRIGGGVDLSILNSDLGGSPEARALATAAAGALRALSGGRWLIAPSIELYARRGGTP